MRLGVLGVPMASRDELFVGDLLDLAVSFLIFQIFFCIKIHNFESIKISREKQDATCMGRVNCQSFMILEKFPENSF